MSHFSILAAFELPWGGERHPLAAEHARSSEERAQQYGMIEGGDEDERTRRFRARVELDAHVYPYCSLERLSIAGGFNQWLYFLADQYDNQPQSHADLERVRAVMQRVLDLLCGAPLAKLPPPFERYTRACRRELWALMPSGFLERFARHLEEYLLQGALVSLGHRLRHDTLGLDGYIELRALASGVYPALDCIEIAADLRLPPEVLEDPVLAQLVHAAVRHIALVNDVFSFEEGALDGGSTVNLIHVLRYRENRSSESAAQRAGEIVAGFAQSFTRLEQRLPRFGTAIDAQVSAYVAGLKHWLRGNVDFSLQHERFRSGTTLLGRMSAPPARSA
jgi:5-epi-alpha-selinene synthase